MTAAELAAVLDRLGAVEVHGIARVPGGWSVQVGVVPTDAVPSYAASRVAYEVTDGVHLKGGEFRPTAGFCTISHCWMERTPSGTAVWITTQPVQAGPVERWRAGAA